MLGSAVEIIPFINYIVWCIGDYLRHEDKDLLILLISDSEIGSRSGVGFIRKAVEMMFIALFKILCTSIMLTATSLHGDKCLYGHVFSGAT